jgi:hypothetical protein
MLRGPIPAISDPSSLSTHPLVQSRSSNNHQISNRDHQQRRINGLNQRLEYIRPLSPVIRDLRTNNLLNSLKIPQISSSSPSSAVTVVPDLHSLHQHQNGQSSSSSSSIIVHVPPVELDQSNHQSYFAVKEAEVESIITNGLANNQAVLLV